MKNRVSPIFLILTGFASNASYGQVASSTPELVESAGYGDVEAGFQMARAFLYGEGVPKAPAKAFELMMSAATKDHPDAAGGLGYLYLNGIGVRKDPVEALVWFRKGAELGSAKAQLNLARCLLGNERAAGLPRPGDPAEKEKATREGLDWMAKAAKQGQVEAAASLGRYHYFGENGFQADKAAAEPWLLIAAEGGDDVSQNLLGVMYDPKIQGGRKDPGMARKWYEKSAMQGNLKAQSNLGRLMDPFSDDPATRAEALAWILIAKTDGEVTARRFLEDNKLALEPADLQAANERMNVIRSEMQKSLLQR